MSHKAGHNRPHGHGPKGSTTPYGPQPMERPAGSVLITAGSSIQAAIDANPEGTVFWLVAGAPYYQLASITPKHNITLAGEYGATLSGLGWVSADPTDAGVRAHNQNIDGVTLLNLRIENMPQYGVRSYVDFSSGWRVEHCEITRCEKGIEVCHDSITRRCWVHDIRDAGYTGNTPSNVLIEACLFEDILGTLNQKLVEGSNHRIIGNHLRRLAGNGLWEDGNNEQVVILGNTIEDCAGAGIFYEISRRAVIQGNTIRRCHTHGVLVSTSKEVTVEDNDITDCFRGIWNQVNLDILDDPNGAPIGGWDLADNIIRGNRVRLSAAAAAAFLVEWGSSAYNAGIDHSGTEVSPTPYLDGTKNIDYLGNAHFVPDSGDYWFNGGVKTWAQWQALPQDASGSRTIG